MHFNGKWFIIFTGRPNAGKSSLLSQLTGVNIASGKRPGTTKSFREVATYATPDPISLVDLPGFGRITGMKKELVERTKDNIINLIEDLSSQIILGVHVLDLTTFFKVSKNLERKGIIPIDQEMVQFLKELSIPTWIAANKIDRLKIQEEPLLLKELGRLMPPNIPIYPMSCRSGKGVSIIKTEMKNYVEMNLGTSFSHNFLKKRI